MLNWIVEIELIICIKMDLVLNNLQRLICYKTQPTNQQTNQPSTIHHFGYYESVLAGQSIKETNRFR